VNVEIDMMGFDVTVKVLYIGAAMGFYPKYIDALYDPSDKDTLMRDSESPPLIQTIFPTSSGHQTNHRVEFTQ
jgi:hypothetical protein